MGKISLSGDNLARQRQALMAEGIEVTPEGKIVLRRYRWEVTEMTAQELKQKA